MADFSVAVNIAARLQRSYSTAFRRAENQARRSGQRIQSAGQTAGRGFAATGRVMDRVGSNRAIQVGAVGAAAALTKAVHTAVRLEDSMLDLQKVAGNLGAEGLERFTKDLEAFAVSGKTKSSVEELYAAASSLAQVGFARDPEFLLNWTKLAGRAAIAFDVSSAQAAEGLSKTVAALGADKSLAEQFGMASNLATPTTTSRTTWARPRPSCCFSTSGPPAPPRASG